MDRVLGVVLSRASQVDHFGSDIFRYNAGSYPGDALSSPVDFICRLTAGFKCDAGHGSLYRIP